MKTFGKFLYWAVIFSKSFKMLYYKSNMNTLLELSRTVLARAPSVAYPTACLKSHK